MTGLLGYVMHPQSTPTLLHKSPIVCNQMSLAVCDWHYMSKMYNWICSEATLTFFLKILISKGGDFLIHISSFKGSSFPQNFHKSKFQSSYVQKKRFARCGRFQNKGYYGPSATCFFSSFLWHIILSFFVFDWMALVRHSAARIFCQF